MLVLLLNDLYTQQYRVSPQFQSLRLNQLQDNIFFILVEVNVQEYLFNDECVNLNIVIYDANQDVISIDQLSQYYIDSVCQLTFKLPSYLASQTIRIVIQQQTQAIYSNYFPVLNDVEKNLEFLWYIIILAILLLLINSPLFWLFFQNRKASLQHRKMNKCCKVNEIQQHTKFDEIHFQKLMFYNDSIVQTASDVTKSGEVLPKYFTVESTLFLVFTIESKNVYNVIQKLDTSATVSSYFHFYHNDMNKICFAFENFDQQQQFYFIIEQQDSCLVLFSVAESMQILNLQSKDARYTYLQELELLQNERCYIKQPLNLQYIKDSHKKFLNESIKFISIRGRWTDYLKLNKPCALQSQIEPKLYEQNYKPSMLDMKIIDDIASINSKYNDICSLNSQSYYTPSKQGGVKNESEQPLNDIFNEPLTRGSQGARFYDQYNLEPQAKGTNIASMAISGTQTPDRFIRKKKERELDPNELIIQVGQQLNKKEQSQIIQNNGELKQEDDFDFKLVSDLELPYFNDTTSLLNNLDNQLVKLNQVQDEVRLSHDSDHQFALSKNVQDMKRVSLIYNSVSQKLFQIPEMITSDTETDTQLLKGSNKKDSRFKDGNITNQISNPFAIPVYNFSETLGLEPDNHQFAQQVNCPPLNENILFRTEQSDEYNPFALPKQDFQPEPIGINIFDDPMNNPFNLMNPNVLPQLSNNISQKSNQIDIENDRFLVQQQHEREEDVLIFPQPISSNIKSVDWSQIGEKQAETNNQMNLEFDANAFVKQDIFAEISEKGNSYNYVLNCEPEIIKNIFLTRDEYHHVFPLELEFENQSTQQYQQRLTAIQNNKDRQLQILDTCIQQPANMIDYLITIGQGGRFILASRFVFNYLLTHQLLDIRWIFIDLKSINITKLFIPCILLDYDIQQQTEAFLTYEFYQHMNSERVAIVQTCIFLSSFVYLEQFSFENIIEKLTSYAGSISQTLGTLFIQPQNKVEFLELLKEFIQ